MLVRRGRRAKFPGEMNRYVSFEGVERRGVSSGVPMGRWVRVVYSLWLKAYRLHVGWVRLERRSGRPEMFSSD